LAQPLMRAHVWHSAGGCELSQPQRAPPWLCSKATIRSGQLRHQPQTLAPGPISICQPQARADPPLTPSRSSPHAPQAATQALYCGPPKPGDRTAAEIARACSETAVRSAAILQQVSCQRRRGSAADPGSDNCRSRLAAETNVRPVLPWDGRYENMRPRALQRSFFTNPPYER